MDILSNQLDAAVTQGSLGTHPLCVDPLITHLSFEDDILVFFDGTEASLVAILDILAHFKSNSGLSINLTKSCLFLDGDNQDLISLLAARHNVSHGSLPVRYLGVPLIAPQIECLRLSTSHR